MQCDPCFVTLYVSGLRSQDVVSLANTFKKNYLCFLESYVLKLFLVSLTVKQPGAVTVCSSL